VFKKNNDKKQKVIWKCLIHWFIVWFF